VYIVALNFCIVVRCIVIGCSLRYCKFSMAELREEQPKRPSYIHMLWTALKELVQASQQLS